MLNGHITQRQIGPDCYSEPFKEPYVAWQGHMAIYNSCSRPEHHRTLLINDGIHEKCLVRCHAILVILGVRAVVEHCLYFVTMLIVGFWHICLVVVHSL